MFKTICCLILLMACAGSDDSASPVDAGDAGAVGQTTQAWGATFRPEQLIGTRHYSENNARCTPTQASDKVCFLVKPLFQSGAFPLPQVYAIWVDEASFGLVYGPSIRNAVIAAIDKLNNPGLKTSANVLYASFVLQSQSAGSQIRFSSINLAASSSVFLPDHMRVEFGQTSTVPDKKGPLPGTDMPGIWKTAGYANVRLDQQNLADQPVIDSATFLYAAVHGILLSIGMGGQSLYTDTFTSNFLPSGAMPSNGWGPRCEEKYVFFKQSIGTGTDTDVFFTAAAGGPCALP